MKKLFLSATILAAGAFCTLAQGLVNFDNGDWNFTDGIDRNVYADAVGGTKLDQPTWSAGLFELVNGSYVQLGTKCSFDFGNGATVPGVWAWDGADRTISKAKGVDTTLHVSIFNNTGALVASSPDFTYRHVAAEPAGTADVLLVNFRAFAVPEPSTVALGVLGLGALLLFRRRK
jgi:hypothetical protein